MQLVGHIPLATFLIFYLGDMQQWAFVCFFVYLRLIVVPIYIAVPIMDVVLLAATYYEQGFFHALQQSFLSTLLFVCVHCGFMYVLVCQQIESFLKKSNQGSRTCEEMIRDNERKSVEIFLINVHMFDLLSKVHGNIRINKHNSEILFRTYSVRLHLHDVLESFDPARTMVEYGVVNLHQIMLIVGAILHHKCPDKKLTFEDQCENVETARHVITDEMYLVKTLLTCVYMSLDSCKERVKVYFDEYKKYLLRLRITTERTHPIKVGKMLFPSLSYHDVKKMFRKTDGVVSMDSPCVITIQIPIVLMDSFLYTKYRLRDERDSMYAQFQAERTLHILVVDDSSFMRKTIQHYYRDENHELHFAASVEEAIMQLHMHSEINFIISDVNLGGKSGLDLLLDIRDGNVIENKNIFVMLLTGDNTIKVRNCPYTSVVYKPFKKSDIQNCIDDMCSEKKNP